MNKLPVRARGYDDPMNAIFHAGWFMLGVWIRCEWCYERLARVWISFALAAKTLGFGVIQTTVMPSVSNWDNCISYNWTYKS